MKKKPCRKPIPTYQDTPAQTRLDQIASEIIEANKPIHPPPEPKFLINPPIPNRPESPPPRACHHCGKKHEALVFTRSTKHNLSIFTLCSEACAISAGFKQAAKPTPSAKG